MLYAAGAAIAIDQYADLVATVWPLKPGELQWRFGFLGLFLGRMAPLLMADLLIIMGAIGMGHRLFLRLWGVLHIVLTVVLLGILGLFVLDALQVRTLVPPDGTRRLLFASGRAFGAGLMLAVVSVVIAVAGLRTGKPERTVRGGTAADALIVGGRKREEAAGA